MYLKKWSLRNWQFSEKRMLVQKISCNTFASPWQSLAYTDKVKHVIIVQCLLSFTLLPGWLDSSHVCIFWRSPSHCGETAGSRSPTWPADEGTASAVEMGSGAINKTSWYGLVGMWLSKPHTGETIAHMCVYVCLYACLPACGRLL